MSFFSQFVKLLKFGINSLYLQIEKFLRYRYMVFNNHFFCDIFLSILIGSFLASIFLLFFQVEKTDISLFSLNFYIYIIKKIIFQVFQCVVPERIVINFANVVYLCSTNFLITNNEIISETSL